MSIGARALCAARTNGVSWSLVRCFRCAMELDDCFKLSQPENVFAFIYVNFSKPEPASPL
jgi:hypothetical protein